MNHAISAEPTLRIDVVVAPLPVSKPRRRYRQRDRVPVALAVAAILFAGINAALFLVFDVGHPTWRDPEFGVRLAQLQRWKTLHPERKLVVILGSSRTAQGLCPSEMDDGTGPLVFNMSLAGGGPVCQMLVLQRLLHFGITPDSLIVEYWPPLLRDDGNYHEQHRLDAKRLLGSDEPVVERYFPHPQVAWKQRASDTGWSLGAHRKQILSVALPCCLPEADRTDGAWNALDDHGWWPGRTTVTSHRVEEGWATVEYFYKPMYAGYALGTQHCAAFADVHRWARDNRIPVLMVQMPESTRFQRMKTPRADALAETHLKQILNEFHPTWIDARTWAEDHELPDGFHLTQAGAKRFSRRFLGTAAALWLASVQQPFR